MGSEHDDVLQSEGLLAHRLLFDCDADASKPLGSR